MQGTATSPPSTVHRKRSAWELRAFFIWRIADGRLVESWGVADRFAFLQELGVVPSDNELAARTRM